MKRLFYFALITLFMYPLTSCNRSEVVLQEQNSLGEAKDFVSTIHNYRESKEMDKLVSVLEDIYTDAFHDGTIDAKKAHEILGKHIGDNEFKLYTSQALRSLNSSSIEDLLAENLNLEQQEIYDSMLLCAMDGSFNDEELIELFSMCEKLSAEDADFMKQVISGLDIMLYSYNSLEIIDVSTRSFWGKFACGIVSSGVGHATGLTAQAIAIVAGVSFAASGGVALAVGLVVGAAFGAVAC